MKSNHVPSSTRQKASLILNKNTLVKIILILFLAAMFLFPVASFRGATSGLLLWFHNVLPSILPFIIISNLIVNLNITGQISRLSYPVLGKLLRLSYEGCYPVIIGFLSGIPIGAKSTADLVSRGKVTIREGQFLIGMCNNASPMFIISYISIAQLKLPGSKYALFAIIYGSSVIGAILYRSLFLRKSDLSIIDISDKVNDKSLRTGHFTFDLLDKSIMNGFEIITRIGGYIILFSILAQIIMEIGPNANYIKAFIVGILEITTGISQICASSMDIHKKIVLVSVLTSFGGLSAVAQTKSVLGNTRLSIQAYLVIKLISAVTALLLSVLYVTLFRI